MVQLSLNFMCNSGLFSNHYLENLVRQNDEWGEDEKAKDAYEKILKLYQSEREWIEEIEGEGQLEQDFITKVFDIINPHYLTRHTIPGPLYPDYIFFSSEEAKRSQDISAAIAIGDAKKLGTDFTGGAGKARTPVMQIYDYFTQSGKKWGFLTDGCRWRLLYKDARREYYYEVDLTEILEKEDFNSFKYFYFFFSREAFEIKAMGMCFLDKVYADSVKYSQRVGEELKERVYKALLEVSRGFYQWNENRLDASSGDARARIRTNSLILLYRLLFIFYAEAWKFLPIQNSAYYDISLEKLKEENRVKIDQKPLPLSPSLHGYWDRVKQLFELVDKGNVQMEVPPYNGGLFHKKGWHSRKGSEEVDNFLDVYQIGDTYLAKAIDLLATAPREGGRGVAFVDYSSLDTRHLGSIYEGLLEFRLRMATEPMVVEKGKKGGDVWIPVGKYKGKIPIGKLPDDRRVDAGELYLETEKHERKATGSYYTPDYIVNYIVENTLKPVIQDKLEEARKGKSKRSDAILSIRVLDPAAGSGHFLVRATEFLADNLLEAIGEDIQEGLLSEDKEYTPLWAKREVVARCIYGVDLNTLAVELAKVSLWLNTISNDKPLSFLDHRLKCGNSLIGARLSDLSHYPPSKKKVDKKQETIPGIFIKHLISEVNKIATISDDTLNDVKNKDHMFKDLRESGEFRKIKAFCDVHTSLYFGNEIPPMKTPRGEKAPYKVYHDLIWAIKGNETEWKKKTRGKWSIEAKKIANEKRFFHWEIEFPEIFFDENGKKKEKSGFDAVIGNPPYVNANELNKILSEFEKPFWSKQFQSASGAYDLYILFIEQSINLVRRGQLSSLITPNKFLSAPYAKALREHIYSRAQIVSLLNLSRTRVFEDPSIYPIISIIRNQVSPDVYSIVTEVPRDQENPMDTVTYKNDSDTLTLLPDMIWGFLISEQLPLILKAVKVSTQLQQCSTVRASSTASEADAYEDALSETSIGDGKRFINTGLIDRYATLWGVEPLTHKGVTFMTPYLLLAQPVVPSERKSQYEKEKIVFAKMALRIEAFLDENGEYASANTNFVYDSDYDLYYLTTILNSRFMTALYSIYFGTLIMSAGYFQIQAPQLRVLPIRLISFTTPENEHPRLVSELKDLYSADDFDEILSRVESYLPKDDEGNFITEQEKSDVVHDLLAFLAEQMIGMNKEKQNLTQKFWTDLDGKVIDEETFAKLRKGKQGSSLYKKESCQPYVEEGSHTTHSLDEALQWSSEAFKDFVKVLAGRVSDLSDIVSVYEKHSDDVGGIARKIKATDELIDQIVYKLYGLTEEEIRLVEEAVK